MDAGLEEPLVREQAPVAVLGIRRLLVYKSSHDEIVVPESTFLNVSVRLELVTNQNQSKDVGFAALVLRTSPFLNFGSFQTVLISPVVCFSIFGAKSIVFVERLYQVHATFPVSSKDHEARKVIKSDGSDVIERYVTF